MASMYNMWRNVSRAIRATGAGSVRAGLGERLAWTRPLSTGRAALAGVAVGDEAVFTQDHVEMREVR